MQSNHTNPSPSQFSISKTANDFLDNLAKQLEIPDSRYEEAERRYKSVGQWLCREKSTLRHLNPRVHIQGSFGLGTVIRPVLEEEDYDIDMVAEFSADLSQTTQKQLKNALLFEMTEYARAYSMDEVEPHRRCVRLNYADDAQFHIDITPGVPNGKAQRALLKARGFDNDWIDLSIAITDEKHWGYAVLNPNWPNSNPRGYLKWFHSRMLVTFEQRRQALALLGKIKVENIPDYKVKTPLQTAIQILKRHRDMTLDDLRPIEQTRLIVKILDSLNSPVLHKDYIGYQHYDKHLPIDLPYSYQWMKGISRNPFQRNITWEMSDSTYNTCDWLHVTQFDTTLNGNTWQTELNTKAYNKRDKIYMDEPYYDLNKSVAVKANYNNNNEFSISTSRVKEIELFISPVMVNLQNPVIIIVNGKEVFNKKIIADKVFLLNNFNSTFDRKALWVTSIKVKTN